MYEYQTDFYRFLASFAVQSAKRIVPKVAAAVPVRSVVDFGCGHGGWLSVWAAMEVLVTGVDGPYVDRRLLLIDAKTFMLPTLQRRSGSRGNSIWYRAWRSPSIFPPRKPDNSSTR